MFEELKKFIDNAKEIYRWITDGGGDDSGGKSKEKKYPFWTDSNCPYCACKIIKITKVHVWAQDVTLCECTRCGEQWNKR